MATEQEASTVAGAQFTVDDFVDVRWSEMPTYSPDGSRITYRANHSGVMQAYVVDASGGEPTRLTQTDGVIYGVRYRPRHDEVNFTAAGCSCPRLSRTRGCWTSRDPAPVSTSR